MTESLPLRYLTVTDVIALHEAIMERMGQPPAALRDEGLLESAVRRPLTASYYTGADLIRQAVVLAVGISQSQAFVDGNKRTAFAAFDTFLLLNGVVTEIDSLELARQIELVAERQDSVESATDRFEIWLRQRLGPEIPSAID
ncbi:MAG: type II toxin-antitoxin system death-on-curing family toxin [Chloroflexota bacterium]